MKAKIIKLTFTVILLILIAIGMLYAVGHLLPHAPSRIFEDSINSIVELRGASESIGESFGSAVCISEGVLVTNAHVVTYKKMGDTHCFDEYSIRFASSNDYHAAELIKYDLELDIAMLKINDDTLPISPIRIGDSESLAFGEAVYAIGNGSNYGLAITKGIVSIPKVNIEYEDRVREVIQSDITISPGNSGGALLDARGELIGITTFRTKDDKGNVNYGYTYSIPIRLVSEYLNS